MGRRPTKVSEPVGSKAETSPINSMTSRTNRCGLQVWYLNGRLGRKLIGVHPGQAFGGSRRILTLSPAESLKLMARGCQAFNRRPTDGTIRIGTRARAGFHVTG